MYVNRCAGNVNRTLRYSGIRGEDAKSGDTIHIILECVDGGGTNPIAYQRVIITVN